MSRIVCEPMAAAEPTRAMVEQAVAWHQRLSDAEAGLAEREAWSRWREADPRHALAYDRIAALWQRFDHLQSPPAQAALEAGLRPKPRKSRRKTLVAATLGLFLGSGWVFMHLTQGMPWPTHLFADYRTGVGEQSHATLDDGSRLVLNSSSAADVAYGPKERRVTLRAGEVLVEVARDAQRPFVVVTPQGIAQARGTRYLVRRHPRSTEVTVLESVVRVCADTLDSCQDLRAGERARIHAHQVERLSPVEPFAAEGWAHGVLVIDDRPLNEVLEELSRYRVGLLHFDPQALAGMRISGVLPLRHTDQALEVIAATQPVRIRRHATWFVVVEPH
ncbi:FecR family protein [Hylemonella sp. W303a]|uniref:FecR family protein n=1 Tax=Hylemonella sp. W303a TaxID=3389873 RepID=UPI00396B4853